MRALPTPGGQRGDRSDCGRYRWLGVHVVSGYVSTSAGVMLAAAGGVAVSDMPTNEQAQVATLRRRATRTRDGRMRR
jgi:hypothetical protein